MENIPRGNQSRSIDLTPEENEAMKKCTSTSIWTYSLPAMIASSAFLRFLQYRGVTLKFWANTSAVIGAGILGRIAALPGCMQEVVSKYPEGTLAKTLEEMKIKRQGIIQHDREGYEQPDDKSGNFEPYPKPSPQGGSSTQSPGQTYDDLRRRNRDQFIESRRPARSSPTPPQDQPPSGSMYSPGPEPSSSMYSSLPEPSGSIYYDPPSPYSDASPGVSTQEDSKIRRRKRVNQYGDEIED